MPQHSARARARRPLRFLGVGTILLAAAAGCAPRGPVLPPTEPGAEGARTLIRIYSDRACPTTLSADLEIVVAPAGGSRILLTGSARAAWPARARVQARAGAFVPVVSIAVAEDSAFVSLPRQKAFWRGPSDRLDGGGIAGTASGLLWILCPAPLLQKLQDPVLDRTPSGWTLRGKLADMTPSLWAEFRLPRDRSRIAEILLRDPDGRIRLRAWRNGTRNVGGAAIPNSIRIQSGEDRGWIEIRILKAKPDPDQPMGLFRLQPAPEVRILDDEELDSFVRGLGSGS